MKERKNLLINKAIMSYGPKIDPCGDFISFYDCFTIENNKLCFWFNINKNTKVLIED